MFSAAHWDRTTATPLAGCIEAPGHSGSFARETTVDGVECARASLMEYLSVSRVVEQVILPPPAEVSIVIEVSDRIPTEGAKRP